MKVVFLDFDGVLNSHRWLEANRAHTETAPLWFNDNFDPAACERINRITSATGAKIVVSSSRRFIYSLPKLQAVLKNCGITGEVIGSTPKLGGKRGNEIAQWLNDCSRVESFVILDDDGDMVHLMDRLVRTSMDDGLQDNHVEMAIAMLSAEVKAA